jgi:hypothetical protein
MMTSTNAGTPSSQARTYLPMIDPSPVELSKVELVRFPHAPNGTCGQSGARRYRAVRIAPAMSELQSRGAGLRNKPLFPL